MGGNCRRLGPTPHQPIGAQYKRDERGSTATSFRYVFAHKDDRNRELYLAVIAFDVPAQAT